VLVDDEGAWIVSTKAAYQYETDQYGEVYLELSALDLSNEQAIADFVQRHHALGVWSPEWTNDFDEYGHFGFPEESGFDAVAWRLQEDRDRIEKAAGVGAIESLTEFRWGAWALRDMLTAWRITKGEMSEDAAVWEAPCWKESINQIDENKADWIGGVHVTSVLSRGMKNALRPFSPRVTWRPDDYDIGPHGRTSEELPLYSVLALELFNHMAEGANYRRCANETCGRFFVRQTGRSVHGQHRTSGVKYCSAECARAQAQRQYRRRKAGQAGRAND